MKDDTLTLIDLNIIEYLLEHKRAKSGYEIAKAFKKSSTHRNLYNQRLKLHMEQGTIYIDSEGYYRLRMENQPEILKATVKDLISLHPSAIKRIVNAKETVKAKTFSVDIKKIASDDKVKNNLNKLTDKFISD